MVVRSAVDAVVMGLEGGKEKQVQELLDDARVAIGADDDGH